MVERPIKKSERQSQGSTDNNSDKSDSISPIESNPKSSKPTRNRSSGTEKKASNYGDDNRQPGNPALARGPKPVKPPAKVKTEELETESEPISEESEE